ncbi:unnamed protein product [Amoebophrya sp. A25]|nr:unnamed protein product [Amoebophrya sp. A25]|eukprot:GSA25T00011346001.1
MSPFLYGPADSAPSTGRRPLKYEPAVFADIGSMSHKLFFVIFGVWNFMHVVQLFMEDSCDTFFATRSCTETEYWVQLWFGYGFFWCTENWLFLAYLGLYSEPAAEGPDYIRRLVRLQPFFSSRCIIHITMIIA